MKYIKFINLNQNAGLLHHYSNLKRMIKKSYILDKIPIIPKLYMSCKKCGSYHCGTHNSVCNKNERFYSNYSDWFDYSKLKVNGKSFKVILDSSNVNEEDIFVFDLYEEIQNVPTYGCLFTWPEFSTDEMNKLSFELPFKKEIIKMSQKIILKMNKYICVHVRRGDVLWQKDGLEEKTQSKNILKVLNKLIDNSYNIYVMTNETDLTLFDDIKNKYNTYFYTDFKELKDIIELDNYKLFSIELLIMKNANKKISTFDRHYPFGIGYNDRWLYDDCK
tara:strand:+ start:1049 stop:1876 length:828 start_codon:yes stop_codon:yes gene_type:complete